MRLTEPMCAAVTTRQRENPLPARQELSFLAQVQLLLRQVVDSIQISTPWSSSSGITDVKATPGAKKR